MVGTWTPPGAIFTVEFDDETWTLRLVKRTSIPEDEPISWMTFDVSNYVDHVYFGTPTSLRTRVECPFHAAYTDKHLWSFHEEMVQPCRERSR